MCKGKGGDLVVLDTYAKSNLVRHTLSKYCKLTNFFVYNGWFIVIIACFIGCDSSHNIVSVSFKISVLSNISIESAVQCVFFFLKNELISKQIRISYWLIITFYWIYCERGRTRSESIISLKLDIDHKMIIIIMMIKTNHAKCLSLTSSMSSEVKSVLWGVKDVALFKILHEQSQ